MRLGENIAKLRKKCNLTQEQLGQALNVSGQAVGKWEKGGFPDAEMIPQIAECLHVSIDELYGRNSDPIDDLSIKLFHWLSTISCETRMEALFELLCRASLLPYYLNDNVMLNQMISGIADLPVESCYSSSFMGHHGERAWMHSVYYLTQGLQLAVPARDCPFFLLMPEPPQGYESNFASNERYRGLFSALSLPGSLEILRYLYRSRASFHFSAVISKKTGLPTEQCNSALSVLERCSLVEKKQIETSSGLEYVYCVHNNGAIVPFLFLAKWLTEEEDVWIGAYFDRDKPILEERKS